MPSPLRSFWSADQCHVPEVIQHFMIVTAMSCSFFLIGPHDVCLSVQAYIGVTEDGALLPLIVCGGE